MNFDQQFCEILYRAIQSPRGMSRGFVMYENLRAYIRIGRKRMPDDSFPSCVQLANLNVIHKKYQRSGNFSRMLHRMLELTDKPIYVETVRNPEFGDALLRHGFIIVNELDGVIRDMVLFHRK